MGGTSDVAPDIPLRRSVAGWVFQMGGLPSSGLILAVVALVAVSREPDRRALWITASVFLALSLTGFAVNTRLRGHELRWGLRGRPRRVNLREVVAIREAKVPSYRGFEVPGIALELASGHVVPIATSTHLGRHRRARWMAAIEDVRQTAASPSSATWRETASQPVQDDLDGLVNAALLRAEQALEEHGEFRPYAVALALTGEMSVVTSDRRRGERRSNDDLLVELGERLRRDRDELRALAIVSEAWLAASDAVRVELEHRDGASLTMFLPYVRRRLFGDVRYGALESRAGAPRVWSKGEVP